MLQRRQHRHPTGSTQSDAEDSTVTPLLAAGRHITESLFPQLSCGTLRGMIEADHPHELTAEEGLLRCTANTHLHYPPLTHTVHRGTTRESRPHLAAFQHRGKRICGGPKLGLHMSSSIKLFAAALGAMI